MRTSNSIKNSVSSFVVNIVSIIIGFIAQAIFIRILGAEYLGLNGLFSNVLNMLSIFELGIGSAIVYNLYKPLADNDKETIKSLMVFYKKSYYYIMFFIGFFGVLLIPFLSLIVGKVTVEINVTIIYLLFLSSTLCSYFITYKRNLIYANQQNYIINIVHGGYLIVLNILQVLFLYFTRDFYLYLIIKIICQLGENIVINIIANKKFPFILEKNVKCLDKKIEKDIFKKVKALLFHKVGSILVLGTDNIIISSFLGVTTVGYYSNYSTIITAVNSLFGRIISSTTSSVGNLLVENSFEKNYAAFKKIRFLNFWLSCFAATSLLVIIQPFIIIWIGKEYLLDIFVVVVLVVNYFFVSMRASYSAFKDSAGIWQEDKYVPLIESGLNIIFSIILLKYFGLVGVFLGTLISGLALWCYSYPKFIYKKLFNRSYKSYFLETIGYFIIFMLIIFSTYGLSSCFQVVNPFLQVVINALLCIVVPNLLMIIIFYRTDNFKYFQNLFMSIMKKIKR